MKFTFHKTKTTNNGKTVVTTKKTYDVFGAKKTVEKTVTKKLFR